MKKLLLILIVYAPLMGRAQVVVDSAAIMQVDSLIQVSRNLTAKGDLQEALEISAIAKSVSLEKLGQESAAYGSTCFNHGRIFNFRGEYPEAEKWYIESKIIREKVLGNDHPDYAWSLNNLANLYMDMNQFEKAEPLHKEAKDIRKKVLGKDHPDYASSSYNLANLYLYMGQYEKAELNYLETKTIWEKLLGKDHSDNAAVLINLGILYREMGQYEKAEKLYLEAKEIFEIRLNNRTHPYYWNCLNNMADLYRTIGQYEKAETYFQEIRAIWEKALGKDHINYAAVTANLGLVFQELGQYENAEQLFLEAKEIIEIKLNNKTHPFYWNCLGNLAILYTNIGQHSKAELLYLEAIELFEIQLNDKNHPFYWNSLNNLGNLYTLMGQYEKAELLYKEVMELFEIQLNDRNHPYYWNCLNNLGNLYIRIGQFEKAQQLILESKSFREKYLGKNNPDYSKSVNSLAILYTSMQEYDKAKLYYEELSGLNQKFLIKAQLHLTEKELGNYLKMFSECKDQVLSCNQLKGGDDLSAECFDNSLFYKGFLLQSAVQVKRIAQTNPQTSETFNRLKAYQRQLESEYSKPIAQRDSAKIADLEAKTNVLEKELTLKVTSFGRGLQQVQWKEVQQVLPPGEAAIEFVHYQFYKETSTDGTMYAALLLLPGDAVPKYIFLFEEKSLDSLLHTRGERKADYVNALYSMGERGAEEIGKSKKSLYHLLWQPMEKFLQGVHKIYFSSTGLLYRINLRAIPINDEKTLDDQYELVELGSMRQLVLPATEQSTNNRSVLFGGVNYEIDSSDFIAANSEITEATIASRAEINFNNAESATRGSHWNYLKWTEKEIQALGLILKESNISSTSYSGIHATEEKLKSLGESNTSPRILHVATHGFFFADPKLKSESSSHAIGEEPVFKISEHPMIRSGLLLAGSNYAWKTGKPINEKMEDGILTAYEVSHLNLSNTELVVLSACETGLGEIKGNEGVYGLQRAFKIAGVKYLIMSLWQVPDYQTQELMTTFYSKWLKEKLSIPDAFRSAQKEMRDKYQNPYFWAGFVLVE